jgi:hypothetical protein
VTLREDDTASIECKGVDVTLNGNDLFKRRQLPEEMSVSSYLVLSKAIWKRETGSLRNFPHKEFAALFERMKVSKLVTEA